MLIYIIHNDDIDIFRLPKEVSGNYMLTDTDSEGKTRSILTVSSDNGKWYFRSNYDARIIENDTHVAGVFAELYRLYTIEYCEKEIIYFYILPGFDTSNIIKNVKDNTAITIGSDSSCDVVCSNGLMDFKQLELKFENGIWKITNLSNKIVCYVNNIRYKDDLLSNFDRIFVSGIRIVVINNRLIFYSCPGTLSFNNEKLLDDPYFLATEDKESKDGVKEFYNKDDYFYKSPIFKKKYDSHKITIIEPERKEDKRDGSFLSSFIPSLLMSITSIVTLYFTLTKKDAQQDTESFITNVLMTVIFLITGIIWPIIEAIASNIRFKINAKMRVKTYNKYLERKEKEIKDAVEKEKNVLIFNNISLQECQEAIYSRNSNLYSRNIENSFFLKLKFGTGKVKSSVEISYSKPEVIVQTDNLYDKLDELIDKYEYIEDGNFVCSLNNSSIAVIDFNGTSKNFMNALVLQLASLHDYASLKLVVLTHEGSSLNMIRNLNHCWNNDKSFRYFATNLQEGENISSELMKYAEKQSKENRKNDTYYLLISDCIENYKGLKIVDYAIDRNGHEGEMYKPFSILMFTSKVTNVPTGCEYFINYDTECTYFNSEMDEKKIHKFKPSCIDSSINYSKCIELLSNVPIKFNNNDISTSNTLPTKLGFLEMYGVGRIEQLNIYEKWKNAPISSTLQAPLGIDTSGNLLYLDLHEKKHGPHGLIAGMTGSGKSELIVTYILSLSINYSPDEVQFVLIDYKGGGLAGAFENRKTNIKLPHLVGTITNLDKAEMNRTLVSIKSELQRRQKVFNVAIEKLNTGSIDIYKYQMLVRDGALTEPMSHLFIICDEFAELKAQQPDFMDELVSAARIGRSLGVHLILATQKPSGVVDDQIWSNAKFKICCKVQTADDSNEMIRRGDAAYIKESGRFYLQVGYDEYFVLAQSGYSGVQYVPSDVVTTNADNTISFINNNGVVYRNTSLKLTEEAKEKKESLGEELGNILKYIIEVAKTNGFTNKQLWLDNIPPRLFYSDVIEKYNNIVTKAYYIDPIIGEYDDPETQSQGVVQLPITGAGNTVIIGNTSSGKCTLLFTILFSSMINHTNEEVNFYILDFGSEKFNIFRNSPHVGDVLTINDKNKINYFFYMIESEVNRRQKYYSENGGDFILDAKTGKAPFPNIIVMLYGLEVFKENFDDIYEMVFLSILRLSAKVGIEFVITTLTSNAIGSEIDSNSKQRVLLQLSDESDYSYIFKNGHAPKNNPGRGIMLVNGRPLEFQGALICDELKMKSYLEYVFDQLHKVMNYQVKKVPEIPKKLSLSEYKEKITDLKSVPLGINMVTAQQARYDFTNKITLFSAASNNNIFKFYEKFISLMSAMQNTNIIVLNADKELQIKHDEKVKYYDSGFSDIIKVLYANCVKLNSNPSEKKFILIVIGYSSINGFLRKQKNEDEEIKTLEDLIKDCNNDSFKFFLYDNENTFNKIINSDLSNYVDNTYGIWIGIDFEGNGSFDVQTYRRDNINMSNDLIVLVRDSEPSIVKYPSL
jgi:S-DNA-T family DNA segregation ATPase FtsK/SpoIIIE